MCVSVERVALRWPFLFSLCFPVLSLPPHVIVFCINPPPFLRASRRLVCSFFSFVTPLFLKSSLIEAEINKEKNNNFKGYFKWLWSRFEKKWFLSPKWRDDFSKTAVMFKWCAYAAECIYCIVRPCVQSPWYCLHSPITVSAWYDLVVMETQELEDIKEAMFAWKELKRGRKPHRFACALTDGLTQVHGTVCVYAHWSAWVVILLNLLPC